MGDRGLKRSATRCPSTGQYIQIKSGEPSMLSALASATLHSSCRMFTVLAWKKNKKKTELNKHTPPAEVTF